MSLVVSVIHDPELREFSLLQLIDSLCRLMKFVSGVDQFESGLVMRSKALRMR
jgi:hypothetical protein